MDFEAVETASAPAPVGPYSQALRCGEMIYVSGQLPLDPATGNIVEGGIREQTRQLFANLKAIIEAAGSSMGRVVNVTIFLSDWNDFAAFNEVYAEQFERPYPTRSTIQNSRPMGALVGADLIALS